MLNIGLPVSFETAAFLSVCIVQMEQVYSRAPGGLSQQAPDAIPKQEIYLHTINAEVSQAQTLLRQAKATVDTNQKIELCVHTLRICADYQEARDFLITIWPSSPMSNGDLPEASKPAIKLFYCYAHEDKNLRDELEIHLSSLKRRYHLTNWHDRVILPGANWEEEIDKHLNTADLILLLISATLYCWRLSKSL